MTKPKRRSGKRPRWARQFNIAWPLIRFAFLSAAGLLLLLIGIGITFRTLLNPFIAEAASNWNAAIGIFIQGEETVEFTTHILGGILLFLGLFAFAYGARKFIRAIVGVLSPRPVAGVVDTYRRRQILAQGPRVVAIGGGTGLSTLLRGLKQHTSNITAIVCVSDDGGSSGRLVKELGILPPGDLRNCLVALADAEKLMTDLFQYRFTGDSGALSGHSLGNLLLAGLTSQAAGDLDEAVKLASEVLNIRGRVIPATTSHVRLRALVESGAEICGETAIVNSGQRIRRIFLDPEEAEAHPDAIAAIKEADLIVVGPGSVYTSVVPNLLVPGIAEAVAAAECPRIYVCNVMTQPGESDQFTAAEHVVAIEANIPKRVFDTVLLNTAVPSQQILERYREYHQDLVHPDVDRVRHMGLKVVTGNLMSETDTVRHDPFQVASRLMDILR